MLFSERQQGFSLLELAIVLALLGVLSAAFVVRWKDQSDLTVAIQADRLARHIAHIQALSLSWNEVLRLDLAGASYAVRCVNGSGVAPCVNANDIVMDPATRRPFQVILDDGVTVSGPNIEFDTWGRPVSGSSLLTASQTVQLNAATSAWRVTVRPLTGFATVSRL